MKDKLETALTGLIESVTATKDFVLAQAPDVIQQLIAYTTVKYTVLSICVWLLFMAVEGAFIRWYYVDKKATIPEPEPIIWCTLIFGTIIGLAAAATTLKLVKISIAPKVWLLEYAAQLTS